jgi:F1F0 ATPase subunit 2
MDESLPVSLAVVAAGLCLGAQFFGGLWWTVRRSAASPRPALLFLGSLLLRMSIALAGFYFVAGGRWQRMLSCLLGFVLARMAVVRLTRPSNAVHCVPAREGGRAS